MKCNFCGSTYLVKNGRDVYDNSIIQRWKCKSCGSENRTKLMEDEEEISTSTRVEEVIKNNEKHITFTGFNIPQTENEVIDYYKIDLNRWFIDKLKFISRGNEDNPNKQCTVVLKKIIPDNPKCPVLKKIEMPISYNKKKNYREDKNLKKTIVCCDSQIGFRRNLLTNELEPFHDRKALDLFLNLCDYIQPDELILAGDMLDISEGSEKFVKEPEFYYTTQSALLEFAYILEKIVSVLPNTKIIYMLGNHEERVKRFALNNMSFAYTLKQPGTDLSILSLRNLLDLDKLGIDFIEDYPGGQYWINDNLRVIHGEYTKIGSELANSKISTIMGHTHSIDKKFKTSHGRDGIEKMFVQSVGCLCRIDGTVPGVKKQPNWQQSILLVNTVGDKYFDTHDIVFHSGVTIYDGILFEGEDYTKDIEKYFKNLI